MNETDITTRNVGIPMPPGALGAWWKQGARTAFFMRADWRGLQTTPAIVACLVTMPILFALIVQRLYIPGPALFYGPAVFVGWLALALSGWACWLLVPAAPAEVDDGRAPSAIALFAMLTAQSLALGAALALLLVPMVRAGIYSTQALGVWGHWAVWSLALLWIAAAQLVLVWRSDTRRRAARAGATLVLLVAVGLGQWLQPMVFWYTDESRSAAATPEPMHLSQELFEAQQKLLTDRLAAISPRRDGPIDVYAITFSPYADEDVFMRESSMVAGVMAERFGAAERTIQLVNHRSTLHEWPWATTLNLQRTIRHIAATMDREKDVLFIHLTSHGARSGALSAEFWPLALDRLTPQQLKAWLDEAGIRHRIISISACYSGSWVEPLAGDDTLVMTAADADHTSYGCGRGSELTYFGRAMFDEQLRKTGSFEPSHAEARRVIERREVEAGKSDGYSNPQIRIGSAMRELLARLEAQHPTPGP